MTFLPGTSKTKKRKKKNGYVLIDALSTVFIAALVVGSLSTGVATLNLMLSKCQQKIITYMKESYEFEKEPRFESPNL